MKKESKNMKIRVLAEVAVILVASVVTVLGMFFMIMLPLNALAAVGLTLGWTFGCVIAMEKMTEKIADAEVARKK
jgi:hypothetical protein